MFRLCVVFFLFFICSSVFAQEEACSGAKYGYHDKGKHPHTDKGLKDYGLLVADKKFTIHCCGTVRRWRGHVEGAGEVIYQVWRPVGKDEYRLLGQNSASYTEEGSKVIIVPEEERISVEDGDVLGWYTKGKSIMIYDNGGSNNNFIYENMPQVNVGQTLDWDKAQKINRRSYAVEAISEDSRPPSFKNLPHRNIFNVDDIDPNISPDNPTDVWNIELGDPDPQDIPGLVLTMDPASPYFTFKKDTTTVVMTQTPPLDTYVLHFKVTDHCGHSRENNLTVIIKDPSKDPGGIVLPDPDPQPTPAPQPTDPETDPTPDAQPPATNPPRKATGRSDDSDYWDWLVAVIIVSVLVIVLGILLLVFHKLGWLQQRHRTHPNRGPPKDAEKANGTKPAPKMDDLNKPKPADTPKPADPPKPKPTEVNNTPNATRPKEIRVERVETTSTRPMRLDKLGFVAK